MTYRRISDWLRTLSSSATRTSRPRNSFPFKSLSRLKLYTREVYNHRISRGQLLPFPVLTRVYLHRIEMNDTMLLLSACAPSYTGGKRRGQNKKKNKSTSQKTPCNERAVRIFNIHPFQLRKKRTPEVGTISLLNPSLMCLLDRRLFCLFNRSSLRSVFRSAGPDKRTKTVQKGECKSARNCKNREAE